MRVKTAMFTAYPNLISSIAATSVANIAKTVIPVHGMKPTSSILCRLARRRSANMAIVASTAKPQATMAHP
ncbi:hypothetical protein DXH95_09350 [Sphingorhabdus pulchriflava]|uniref:Uncharacterized protein n=1 Tax=Sphingorhabdus pulchriflava TaxID=2292257 RepID=A0A371BIU9_9SPHN|nr:hypothetical protein DXH95_09350 [Sphingorhabdus pulchriflava]